jgi:predicted transcriptional regulator
LLTIAQELVGLVGWAYLSTVYTHDGEYVLSDDAKRAALAMQRLLETLEIVEPRFPRSRTR